MPRFAKVLQKERAVLTDEELGLYLAWEHPNPKFADSARERQVMACMARMFGGLRTGDLHALRWEKFEVADGRFTWGWAPRCKTKRPQRLEVPAMLRPILHDWWERKGRPKIGLVFPTRKGKRAGEARIPGESHARELRRDLRRAFGIDKPTTENRKRGRKFLKVQTWHQVRELTPREQELFEETEETLPVDFHSWRRAITQALRDAGATAQQAMAIVGHSSMAAHGRYLASGGRLVTIPAAALPALPPVSSTTRGQNSEGQTDDQASFLVSRDRIELSTRGFSGHTGGFPNARPSVNLA